MSDILTPTSTTKKLYWRNIVIIGGLYLIGALVFVYQLVRLHPSYNPIRLFGFFPSYRVALPFYALMFFPQLGVTVGYHRGETHQGWKWRYPWVRKAFLGLGAMAGQGDAIGWVYNHWLHHTYQELTGLDPHTPREYPGFKGLLWAQVGWMLCNTPRPEDPNLMARLEADAVLQWQRRWFFPVLVTGFVVPLALGGWDGLMVGGFFRLICSLNCSWMVNSVTHKYGRPAVDSQANPYRADDSRNHRGVALVTCGEGNHGNHHADPRCARHGWRRGDIDPSWWVISWMEWLGLVDGVRKPKPGLVFNQDQLTSPEERLDQTAA